MNDIDFLENLNNSLENLERKIESELEEKAFPNIYVLGLPRSGTTLLYQLIGDYFDVAYPSNIVARFWKTPLVGFKLDEIVGKKNNTFYESYYGQTYDPSSPHEFTWFWNDLLKNYEFKTSHRGRSLKINSDWNEISQKLKNINSLVRKPVVYKPLELIGYELESFYQHIPNSYFVYIEREPLDVACSIAKARIDKNNCLKTWWSSRPYEYEDIKDKHWHEQIVGQIYYLRKMYAEKLSIINKNNWIKINYHDLCNDPKFELNKIKAKFASDIELNKNMNISKLSLNESKPKLNLRMREVLKKEINRVF